jgi:predicted phosphoribosyltransferase
MMTLTRADAGRRLAAGLGALIQETPVIVVLSAGGARVGSEVAGALDAPLDVIAVSRLEVPGRIHATFGAVADGAVLLETDRVRALDLPEDYVAGLVEEARREVQRLSAAWRAGAAEVTVVGRTVVLADDGLGEALAVEAAIRALQESGAARVLFAAPCASRDLQRRLAARRIETVLLFEGDPPTTALICDASFAQTTRGDVGSMVRHSRPGMPAIRAF